MAACGRSRKGHFGVLPASGRVRVGEGGMPLRCASGRARHDAPGPHTAANQLSAVGALANSAGSVPRCRRGKAGAIPVSMCIAPKSSYFPVQNSAALVWGENRRFGGKLQGRADSRRRSARVRRLRCRGAAPGGGASRKWQAAATLLLMAQRRRGARGCPAWFSGKIFDESV